MKCAVHSDVDAVGFCRNCGKAMCAACARPVRDTLYCEDCVATRMGIPPTPAALFTPPGNLPPGDFSAAPAGEWPARSLVPSMSLPDWFYASRCCRPSPSM